MITPKIMDDKDKGLKLLNIKGPCQGAYLTEIRTGSDKWHQISKLFAV